MKKTINIAIFLFISISLVVVSIIFIKPKKEFYVYFNSHLYLSKNKNSFSYEDDVISYKKQDNLVYITNNNDTCVLDKTTNTLIFGIDNEIFSGKIESDNTISIDSSKISNYSAVVKAYEFSNILPDNIKEIDRSKINTPTKRVLNIIFSLIIGLILSILIYPEYLFEFSKTNKKIAIFSISLTTLLTVVSIFYLLILLKL